MDRRVRVDKSPLPLRRNLQRSQPAVYQLHLVLDLRFSNIHLVVALAIEKILELRY